MHTGTGRMRTCICQHKLPLAGSSKQENGTEQGRLSQTATFAQKFRQSCMISFVCTVCTDPDISSTHIAMYRHCMSTLRLIHASQVQSVNASCVAMNGI